MRENNNNNDNNNEYERYPHNDVDHIRSTLEHVRLTVQSVHSTQSDDHIGEGLFVCVCELFVFLVLLFLVFFAINSLYFL